MERSRAGLVAATIEAARPYCGAERLPMTLQLAAGVHLAEDSGPEVSFGTARCRMLAAALTAQPAGPGVTAHHIDECELAWRLAAAGLDLAHPWLVDDADEPPSRSYQW